MYEAAVLGTVVLTISAAADYVRRAWKGETSPVLATWILMVVMMGISFWMYWVSPRKSWTANIAVTSGTINVVIQLVGVTVAHLKHGTLRIAFDPVQRWCLIGGGGVVLFWSITSRPLMAYVLVQCIALIAYMATVRRLWQAERSTEPLLFWVTMFLATSCAIYPAWVRNDPFAWIYLARAVPSTILVIYLIARIRRKMREARN